jgi:hypothetical protein
VDHGITFKILGIVHRPVFYLKHDVSETEIRLSLQVERTQLGPIDRVSLCLRTADRIQSVKSCVLNKRQDDG